MTDVSKVSPRGPANLNCTVLLSCDEQACLDIVVLTEAFLGIDIDSARSSESRLTIEE